MLPPIADRFVAGETAAEAIDQAIGANEAGLGVILNLLGEHYTDRQAVRADMDAYLGLLVDIERAAIDGCISVKPTQLGLEISEELFVDQLTQLVDAARSTGGFVWLDMEGAETTEATVEAFERMAERYPRGVGVCLQANLRRTASDIERLATVDGKIRLVKGAYRETPDIAFQRSSRIDEQYRADLEALFRTREWGIAVGTHDPSMIEHAKQLYTVHGTPMEFQLLKGVRSDAQRELAKTYRTYQYIPYGSRWFSYFTRRIFERTENASFALRAILDR